MRNFLLASFVLASLVFIGCAEKNITKSEASKSVDDNYSIVIKKSIKECKEYNIVLDEQRTNDFMRKSPKATIDKAAQNTVKTTKKLCTFFAGETSLEKVEKVNEFTTKIMNKCQKVGVTLPKEKIHEKITSLPFFVIKKGLAMQNEASVEECELMKRKYK